MEKKPTQNKTKQLSSSGTYALLFFQFTQQAVTTFDSLIYGEKNAIKI